MMSEHYYIVDDTTKEALEISWRHLPFHVGDQEIQSALNSGKLEEFFNDLAHYDMIETGIDPEDYRTGGKLDWERFRKDEEAALAKSKVVVKKSDWIDETAKEELKMVQGWVSGREVANLHVLNDDSIVDAFAIGVVLTDCSWGKDELETRNLELKLLADAKLSPEPVELPKPKTLKLGPLEPGSGKFARRGRTERPKLKKKPEL